MNNEHIRWLKYCVLPKKKIEESYARGLRTSFPLRKLINTKCMLKNYKDGNLKKTKKKSMLRPEKDITYIIIITSLSREINYSYRRICTIKLQAKRNG